MAFNTKRKFCYFKENAITDIDYKDTKLLRRFVTDQGKIRRARNIALMPYINTEQEGS